VLRRTGRDGRRVAACGLLRLTVPRSSGVLALALLGDALLYVALPVDAPAFGVSAGSVGVLLSVNRLVRIVSYGVVQGVAPLLVLRLMWGLAFGALSLTTIVYAVEEPARAGARIGMSRALTAVGPLVALTAGPLLAAQWGSRPAFVVLGVLTVAAIPLATSLPGGRVGVAAPVEGRRRGRMGFLTRRSFLTWWSFSVGFAVDGVFAVSFALLVATVMSTRTAMALTGLVLATRHLAEILLAPAGSLTGLARCRCCGAAACSSRPDSR
jgi:hypothetical protein